ncbi:hypothetical protein [Roseivirga sp. E12]|uniref:hypothetical protein n=1 Tax=Roseivirga sp. E12 TaxID=2819237 RepID=UPI001ABC9FF9|nr:hypothetical protein [Roseivirga sp. E12]MBO3697069.1 hypothetical protein [Roseivirga sp. E12]
MRRDKKPIGRWFGEALLIFLSVYGAFYFDGIKDERARDNEYIRHLKDFKSDLEENQGKFNYELNSEYIRSNGQGYIQGTINRLEAVDSLMATPTRASADSIINLINDGVINSLTPWVFVSPQYEKLDSEYYSFIKNDDLKGKLQMHFRNNQSRINRKEVINDYVKQFYEIEDQLNLKAGGSPANRSILFSNLSVNKLGRIIEGYYSLRNSTINNRGSDSLILIEVKKELELWGEDSN